MAPGLNDKKKKMKRKADSSTGLTTKSLMKGEKKRMKKKKMEGEEGGESTLDLYEAHLSYGLSAEQVQKMRGSKKSREVKKMSLPTLGPVTQYSGIVNEYSPDQTLTPETLGWNEKLRENYESIIENEEDANEGEVRDYLNLIGRYMDLQSIPSTKDYRTVYLAHTINHLIRLRNTIISNNHKQEEALQKDGLDDDVLESLRDQGFVRPSVLILCPFKKDACDIVDRLERIVFGKDGGGEMMNRKRYTDEFIKGNAPAEINTDLAEDFKEVLLGNNDDSFRIGIGLSKKALKMFEPFEKADIILSSPLGLRMILDGDNKRDQHLISSIQIVVVDRADIMLQQNWEHLTLIFSQLSTLPTKINNDISRVRQQYLDGNGKLYMQLLLFSKYSHELFSALMMEHSLNYRGLITHLPSQKGTLEKIEIPLCQELHKIDGDDPSLASDARFNYFKDTFVEGLTMQTCVVVPSYFDFVRVRNHLKRTSESFVMCHEYADYKQIERARDMFFHQKKNVLLVTERYHYFNRRHLRGIHKIIFYQIPSHPDFYADFINMGELEGSTRFKAMLMFSKFDRIRLQNTFGTEMANGILASQRRIQAIVSE